MKILVTGAAGFIGSHLSERLAADGHEVLGIDNFNDYYDPALKRRTAAELSGKGIAIQELDIAEESLADALSGVSYVFHLAGQPGISAAVPFSAYDRNNIVAMDRLLDACAASASFSGLINFSTSSVYGKEAVGDEETAPKPSSVYGATKLAAEQLALGRYRDHGFPAASIRPFSICGERERPEKLYPRVIQALLTDSAFPLYAGSLEHIRSFTYVGDLVDGAMLLLEKFDANKGEIFNIGTNESHRVAEGIALVEEIVGKNAKYEERAAVAGSQTETKANIEKAKTRLGYVPKTGLREMLEKEVAWFRKMER